MNVAITGSSGSIGGRVARQLSKQGFPLTLLLRTPAKAPALPDTRVLACEYGNVEQARKALEGIDLLFMVSAAESPTREAEHRCFVQAATDAGVQHIVYLSFANARPDSTFTLARTHADTENAIRESGMAYTFLRDNFYTELMAQLADEQGVIRGPAGSGRVACVSQRDVADAAARILADIAQVSGKASDAHDQVGSHASQTRVSRAHHNKAYTLTGSQALTMDDIATELTRATGKPHRFHNESIDEAYASRRQGWPDVPDWELDAWVSTYTAIAHGELAEVTGDLPSLLGRAPLTLREVLELG